MRKYAAAHPSSATITIRISAGYDKDRKTRKIALALLSQV
jgi:hypothetical protein